MEDLALGRTFRRVRQRLGWRQIDLARIAGVSPSTCSLIERGQIGSTQEKVHACVEQLLVAGVECSPHAFGVGRGQTRAVVDHRATVLSRVQ